MTSRHRDLLHVRIELDGLAPPIWRELLVPARFSFWDLHVAIQDAMGWWDYHLHEFTVPSAIGGADLRIGIPDDEWGFGDSNEILPCWEILVTDHLDRPGQRIAYLYDFGDDWKHSVTLLGIRAREKGRRYPLCVAGERACPPEDCGGPPGYMRLLEALRKPEAPELAEVADWAPRGFDPERFDPAAVRFTQPTRRLRRMLEADR